MGIQTISDPASGGLSYQPLPSSTSDALPETGRAGQGSATRSRYREPLYSNQKAQARARSSYPSWLILDEEREHTQIRAVQYHCHVCDQARKSTGREGHTCFPSRTQGASCMYSHNEDVPDALLAHVTQNMFRLLYPLNAQKASL